MERRGHGFNTNILDAHLNQINNQFGANFTFGSKLLQQESNAVAGAQLEEVSHVSVRADDSDGNDDASSIRRK